MLTATEIRKQRLEELISRYGSIAALNDALDLARTDATLSQIRNGSPHSKTGKPRVMGDELARRIEEALGLGRGWMDNPPDSEARWLEKHPSLQRAISAMEPLPEYELDRIARVITTLSTALEPDDVTESAQLTRQRG